jgi:hypothetical protein
MGQLNASAAAARRNRISLVLKGMATIMLDANDDYKYPDKDNYASQENKGKKERSKRSSVGQEGWARAGGGFNGGRAQPDREKRG